MWGIDTYERTARLVPALVVFAPVGVVLWDIWGPWNVSVPVFLVVLLVLSVPLAEWTRRRGRKKQPTLWAKWGGSPLATALAEPTEGWCEEFRQRSLSQLHDKYPEVRPIGNNEEDYELMASLAAARSRETESKGVFAENVSYGFARNAFAIRWVGFGVAIACALAVEVVSICLDRPRSVVALSVALLTAGWWLIGATEKRVRDAGNRYANAVIRWLASEPTSE